MDNFMGTIAAFGFNFAPYQWAQCQGQLLPISQYAALFSLLGTAFGGNGTSNFGLPNLQGAAAVGFGQGSGLSPYVMGQTGGHTTQTLTTNNMPLHAHSLTVKINAVTAATATTPVNNYPANTPAGKTVYNAAPVAGVVMGGSAAITMAPIGASVPVSIQRPYQVSNYCIALSGYFPTRQ
jgi:microcystin-dependent protein